MHVGVQFSARHQKVHLYNFTKDNTQPRSAICVICGYPLSFVSLCLCVPLITATAINPPSSAPMVLFVDQLVFLYI